MEKLDGSESGLELFGFYTTPRVDVANWSESRSMSLSQTSYKVGLRFLMIVVAI